MQAARFPSEFVDLTAEFSPVCARIRCVYAVQELPAVDVVPLKLLQVRQQVSQHRERNPTAKHGDAFSSGGAMAATVSLPGCLRRLVAASSLSMKDIISLRALRDVIMNNVTYYVVASSEHDGK